MSTARPLDELDRQFEETAQGELDRQLGETTQGELDRQLGKAALDEPGRSTDERAISKAGRWLREKPVSRSILFAVASILVLNGVSWIFSIMPPYVAVGYANEIAAIVWPLAVLLWFGYGWTLKRGKFFKTLVCGMFWLVIQSYALAGMAWTVMQEPGFRWRSPILIVLGLLSMFGVGFREEAIFRGIIANAIGCRLGKDRRGVWKSVLLSGLIFGLVHLVTLFHGVNPIAALVQCATASALGMVFTAVYYRGGSLWGLVFLHSLTDIAGMFRSNFTELATDLDDLNQLNPLSLILIPIFLLVLAFLLRKKKMPEIMANLQEP